jgi:hypothetical protein
MPAFYQGLRELGYVEGQTISIETRYADQNPRFPDLTAEVVALNLSTIVRTRMAGRAPRDHGGQGTSGPFVADPYAAGRASDSAIFIGTAGI